MAEELKYRIRFTKGTLEGQLFPLGTEPVILGRSHTCGIRLMEPDVSGRHVMLSVGARGVQLEVISARRTQLEGKALKTGETASVPAGQSVTMGGVACFVVECYRSEGEQTIGPDEPTGGMTRFGNDATARPGVVGSRVPRHPGPVAEETSMTTPAAGMESGVGDTGTHIPPPIGGRRAGPSAWRPQPPPMGFAGSTRNHRGGDDTSMGTVGTQAIPDLQPPEATVGTEVLRPAADATQVIQTRAATPQEMAYMRELHNKKRRRRAGMRLALGGLLLAMAAGVYVWVAMHAPEQQLSMPPVTERKVWVVLDADLRPVAEGTSIANAQCIRLAYPPAAGGAVQETSTIANPALHVEETVFSVKTRVGRDLDVPLQLRLETYASKETLSQSQEDAFEEWNRTRGQGLEKQARLAVDFVGVAPGLPCLRYTYTRKATPEEEAAGVLDWAGVLSFFRFRDHCFVYFREVPSVEELRAEYMLLRTEVFLAVGANLVQERWSGLRPDRQYGGDLPILRNSVKELMDKNMDNEWEELEDKLTTILLRTWTRRAAEPDAARLYDEALAWIRILRTRQDETWKRRSVIRFQATHSRDADTKRMDEEIRALFRSPDDRRHVTAQKEKWWVQ